MNLWVIVPVKSLQETKSRLSRILLPGERAELTQTILARTLKLLHTMTAVCQILVVSRDPTVAAIAIHAGCQTIAEPIGSGLNGAVTIGATFAARENASHLLILPADLPFLSRDDLDLLLHQLETTSASSRGRIESPKTLIVCSDQKKEGTNALILPAGSGFRFHYGRYSYQHHQAEAARLGWDCQSLHLPTVQFDLDSEEDYNRYTNKMIARGK